MTDSAPAIPAVPTPCIGVCRMDEAMGLCLGCARTGDEIAAWAQADASYKAGIWQKLPPRRARLELCVYRLPWSPRQIAVFAEATLRKRLGRWRLGVEGAAISFAAGEGEAARIASEPEAITAVTARGGLRLLKHEKTIAFAFGDAGAPRAPEAIGLVLPKGRVVLDTGASADEAGLIPESAFPARFMIRSPDSGLIAALSGGEAGSIRQFSLAAELLLGGRAQAYAETGLGRAETFTAPSADGPSLDLDAQRFAERRELPPGWPLDHVFALGALFYPHRRMTLSELESERG